MPPRHEVFRQTIAAMHASKVPFWIEQGTLLGLIRDGDLIPWDNDIDCGIWTEPGARERIIQALSASGFIMEHLRPEVQCLQFRREDSDLKVDVTFYSDSDGHACTTWLAVVGGWRHALNGAAQLMAAKDPGEFLPKVRGSALFRLAGRWFIRMVGWLPQSILQVCSSPLLYLSRLFPSLAVCRFKVPARMLKTLKIFRFGGAEFHVPADSEGYLTFVYGTDWRVPKRNWDWSAEAGGLTKSPHRPAG